MVVATMSLSDDEDLLLGVTHTKHMSDTVARPPDADGEPMDAAEVTRERSTESDDDASEIAAEAGQNDAPDKHAAEAPEEQQPAEADEWSNITSKKEAKKLLDKASYKLWKKAHRKTKKAKAGKTDDSKGKKKKTKKERRGKVKGAHKKSSARKGREPQSDDGEGDDGSSNGSGSVYKTGRSGRRKRAAAQRAEQTFAFEGAEPRRVTSSAVKPTAKSQQAAEEAACVRLVEDMRMARLADDEALLKGEAPLHRVRLIPAVRAMSNRIRLHEKLVSHGFLVELGGWLVRGGELAPEDLRTTALDALELIPFENAPGGKKLKQKKSKNGDDADDTFAYDGATKEDLKSTNLGYAANFLRQSPKETTRNRAKAAYLLQRLSMAFDETSSTHLDGPSAEKMWLSQGDSTVLPPFVQLQSASERFAQLQSKVDPSDPRSYLKVPPRRPNASYVSGMFEYRLTQNPDAGSPSTI